MTNFIREQRYTVIKNKDAISALNEEERRTLTLLVTKIGLGRAIAHKPDFKCVVVESDWPEYEGVWAAIEKRHNDRTHNVGALGDAIPDYHGVGAV